MGVGAFSSESQAVDNRIAGTDNSRIVGRKGDIVESGAVKAGTLLFPGAANLGKGATYSPTSNTNYHVTGLDPAAALEAIGKIQTNSGQSNTSPAFDASSLGQKLSEAITGAVGAKANTINWVPLVVIGGIVLIGVFVWRKFKA